MCPSVHCITYVKRLMVLNQKKKLVPIDLLTDFKSFNELPHAMPGRFSLSEVCIQYNFDAVNMYPLVFSCYNVPLLTR